MTYINMTLFLRCFRSMRRLGCMYILTFRKRKENVCKSFVLLFIRGDAGVFVSAYSVGNP